MFNKTLKIGLLCACLSILGACASNAPPEKTEQSPAIEGIDARFEKLEGEVLALRREFNTLKPIFLSTRINMIETDLQSLKADLAPMLPEGGKSAGAPVDLAPAPKETAQLSVGQIKPDTLLPAATQAGVKQPPKPAPPRPEPSKPVYKKLDKNTAANIRTGDHGDKTRLVIDAGDAPQYTLDYDPDEKLILLEIKNLKWIDPVQKTLGPDALIASYTVTSLEDKSGSLIAFTLRRNVKILEKNILSPDDNPNYRLYFDLKPQ